MRFIQSLLHFRATPLTDMMMLLQFEICGSSHSDIQPVVPIFWYMQNHSFKPRSFWKSICSCHLTYTQDDDLTIWNQGVLSFGYTMQGPHIPIYAKSLTFVIVVSNDKQKDWMQDPIKDVISVIFLVKRVLFFLTWYPSIVKMLVAIVWYIKRTKSVLYTISEDDLKHWSICHHIHDDSVPTWPNSVDIAAFQT